MKMRKFLIGAALVALPFAAGAFLRQSGPGNEGARLFAQVLQRIENNAVDSLDRAAIYEKAARGLVKNLKDPYADLYSPEEIAAFQRNTLRNNYGGLGMQIEPHDEAIFVGRVFPNTPAAAGGVIAGDQIISVDSVPVTGLKIEEVSAKLLGKPGTQVNVVFGRLGIPQPIKGTFTRGIIRIPAVPYAIVLDGGVGYIPLQSFNDQAAEDVAKSLQTLRQKGAKSFILDLRGNGGGSLDQALEISELFLKPGQQIVVVRHRGREPEISAASRVPVIDSMPVVVMVDGNSASASEIVAGSLQDHDRGLVVGTTSFGKGLVQTLFPLDGGWYVKLTTGKWYTPSGRSIQSEHDRLGDERFVEFAADSAPGDSARKRPVFKSDAGRKILGGGGITPDVVVQLDSTTTAEREFLRTMGPFSQQLYVTVYNFGLDRKSSLKPDFQVTAAMREELYGRLVKAKIPVQRAQFDAVPELIDRLIDQRFTSLAFGDSTAFRRSIGDDPQMKAALDYLRRGTTQRQLLALASGQMVKSQE
ncbi:MAG: S41 family peptidase [Gemmatimonadales bacterium]|nr:S41 family peptidase [Gemmatimonadales bacterium]